MQPSEKRVYKRWPATWCGEVGEEGLDSLGQRLELFRGESAHSDAVLRKIASKLSGQVENVSQSE